MGQVSDLYVKIITNDFQPMNLPVNTVHRVNSVLARYLVKGGYAAVCTSLGALITAPWEPTIQSGSINAAALTLTYDLGMAVTDATGVTVNVNGSPVSLHATTPIAASTTTIVITLLAAVMSGDVVTVDYDHTTGNIVSDVGESAWSLLNYAATNVTP